MTQGWLCARSCSSFAQISLVVSFQSCRRPCKFVQGGPLTASASTCSGGSFSRGQPGRTSLYQKCQVVTRVLLCAHSCSSFARFSLVTSFRLCWRPCKFVWVGRLRASVSTHSGGSFGRGHRQANEPVSKMISCDLTMAHSCSSFALLSLVTSFRSCGHPCKFIRSSRLRAFMSTRSSEGAPGQKILYQKC